MGKIFNHVVLPIILYVMIMLMLIFLPKLITKKYWNGILLLFIGIFLFILILGINIMILKFLPEIKDSLGIEKKSTATTPYADMNEIVKYNINHFSNHPSNPVNIEISTKYRQERTVTVGKEEERTEVCIAKYRNIDPLRQREIYYIANRVEEPNKMAIRQLNYQPSLEEESKIIMEMANRLAKKPSNLKETEIKVEKTPFGNIIETRKVRQEQQTEEGETF